MPKRAMGETPNRGRVQTTAHGNSVLVPEFNVASYQSLLNAPAPSPASRPNAPAAPKAAAKAAAPSNLDWLVKFFLSFIMSVWAAKSIAMVSELFVPALKFRYIQ